MTHDDRYDRHMDARMARTTVLIVFMAVYVCACSNDSRGREDRQATPGESPCPPSSDDEGGTFVVASPVREVSSSPLRWLHGDHLWERSDDPRHPRDLGDARAMGSPVFDDRYWYQATCTQRCNVSHGATYTLFGIPRRLGSTVTIAEDISFAQLAVVDGQLIWGSYGPYGERGEVRRVRRRGAPVETLWRGTAIEELVLDADGLVAVSQNTIVWLPADGSSPRELLTGLREPRAAATDATHVYVAVYGDPYWKSTDSGSIVRVPKAGGPAETLAGPIRWPQAIAVDETRVYWMLRSSPDLWTAPKQGGSAAIVPVHAPPDATSPCKESRGLWSDPLGLYVLRGEEPFLGGTGTLYFVPRARLDELDGR
jgi:hypothetical protein